MPDGDEAKEEGAGDAADDFGGLGDAEEEEEEAAFGGDEQKQLVESMDKRRKVFSSLFKNLTFLIGRETPRDSLEFCIRSFAGDAYWGGAGGSKPRNDDDITHEIVDRPALLGERKPNREYVQPQWIFDSINARVLLPTAAYTVGAKLPPHLSPFVDNDKEGYTPAYGQEIKARQIAAGVRRRTSI